MTDEANFMLAGPFGRVFPASSSPSPEADHDHEGIGHTSLAVREGETEVDGGGFVEEEPLVAKEVGKEGWLGELEG